MRADLDWLDQSEAVIVKHFQKIDQPFFIRLLLAGRSGAWQVGTSRLSQLSSRDPKTRLPKSCILFSFLAWNILCLSIFLFSLRSEILQFRASPLMLFLVILTEEAGEATTRS